MNSVGNAPFSKAGRIALSHKNKTMSTVPRTPSSQVHYTRCTTVDVLHANQPYLHGYRHRREDHFQENAAMEGFFILYKLHED